MWLGPPFMNKKMTRLAEAGNRKDFAASGFFPAAAAFEPDMRSARAIEPNPSAVRWSNDRLDSGCGIWLGKLILS